MVFQFPPFFFYQKLLHKHHENKMVFFILLYTYMYILHIIGDKLPHENRWSFYFRNITSWHHFFSLPLIWIQISSERKIPKKLLMIQINNTPKYLSIYPFKIRVENKVLHQWISQHERTAKFDTEYMHLEITSGNREMLLWRVIKKQHGLFKTFPRVINQVCTFIHIP